MMLNNMDKLNLIEHLQAFYMINVDQKILVCKNLLKHLLNLFPLDAILILDLNSNQKAIFGRFVYLNINLFLLKLIIFELNPSWAFMIAFYVQNVFGFHKHCISLATDVCEYSLYALPIHHCKDRCLNEDLPCRHLLNLVQDFFPVKIF